MLKTATYKLKITFLSPILGSQSTRQVVSEFVAGKKGVALPEDEAATLPEELERATTVFHRAEDGTFLLFNYHVRGFLKEAGKVLNGEVAGGVKNLKSKVDQRVFVTPRKIILNLPEDGEMDYKERPLRAETAQGPRVALARSEMLPEGTWFTCGIEVLPGEITEEVLRDLLDYGYHKGLGQWRGGGWGQFRYELIPENVIENPKATTAEPVEGATLAASGQKRRGPKPKNHIPAQTPVAVPSALPVPA